MLIGHLTAYRKIAGMKFGGNRMFSKMFLAFAMWDAIVGTADWFLVRPYFPNVITPASCTMPVLVCLLLALATRRSAYGFGDLKLVRG